LVGEASNDGACGDSGFKRVNYFSGVLLSERDFLGEQVYNSEKRKLHNRLLHGWGVVCGLKVLPTSPPSRRVIIEPGLAIDCAGNEILVPGPCELDVVAAAAAVEDPGRESDGEGRDGEAMGRLREFCVIIESYCLNSIYIMLSSTTAASDSL
jgi:hypothetical protein